MARIARSELFDHKETNCIFTECTAAPGRLLAGLPSPFSPDRDERRMFIEGVIAVFRQYFAVELIAYTIDDKCIRQMLQPKPTLAQEFSPEDVARRWLIICPSLRRHDAPFHQPSEKDICRLCEDPDRIDRIRQHLSDVAWWNRLLCQRISQHFNKYDNLRGRFWEGRFHSTLLLDRFSRLTCRTSIDNANQFVGTNADTGDNAEARSDQTQKTNARESVTRITHAEYLSLFEWTHQTLTNKPVDTQLATTVLCLFQKRGITPSMWLPLVINFRYHFSQIAGLLENMDRHVSRISRRRLFVRPQARRLLRQQSLS
ncbi:MAG: hypothetical protein RLZZ458_732 [Planctomycetota bacterium]